MWVSFGHETYVHKRGWNRRRVDVPHAWPSAREPGVVKIGQLRKTAEEIVAGDKVVVGVVRVERVPGLPLGDGGAYGRDVADVAERSADMRLPSVKAVLEVTTACTKESECTSNSGR